ncbi:diguanylate cyclase [Pseudomonas capeferrum]|uniref:diguanylate cyclase n=1 Tax=Pseudomonas capeferrum TaxID=1495066 RepID=UPI0015E3B152|nr:diguanylate cyclase [Pseudomonas capeferrum]MBA1203929.1 diguanylate cyclase [Pseudomonas capeferrum]
MTDDAQRWKEKYLESIDQQEKLERRWDARLDLLRRGLVRSTLAAEGSDKAVDQCMKEMRDVIRSKNMDAALAGLIPRLEKAVLDSEQRRETRLTQVSTALNALVSQLQALPLPGDVARPLKKYAKQLDARIGQTRELPLLLGELSGLQGQALMVLQQSEESARPGLLQRLFGNREHESQARNETRQASVEVVSPPSVAAPMEQDFMSTIPAPEPVPVSLTLERVEPFPDTPESLPMAGAEPLAVQATEPAQEMAGPALVDAIEVPLPEGQGFSLPPTLKAEHFDEKGVPDAGSAVLDAVSDSLDEDSLYALPDAAEPPYSSVAAHIEQTFIGLLDDLTLPEHHKAQALAMRERVARGLNWYELIPVLDDLAVLMLAINDSGQHEFEAYLQQLNERLETFQGHLHDASTGHADNSSAARELDSQLREQVDGLQTSVQGAADLGSLKRVLEQRLEGLLVTMDHHQHERGQREQELADRLQGLAERVASMEQEALGYREHLEEQRQKALIDPLTGLPNRAAWAEQVEREILAWQEHGGHLLIAILDLDDFKRINDSYGHLAGDKVLKIVANVLRKRLRGRDFIARFGGEEFVLLLPQTSMTVGVQFVQMLRAAIEACPFHFKGERVVITSSIGISAFRTGERGDAVFKRADKALYRAKGAGRNRVEQD